jgi:hypothetical protein
MDFKQLKKQSSLGSLTEKLLKEAEKMGSSSSEKDSRIFTVERDVSGLGLAIVRFLPAPSGEEAPFVKLYSHGFKNENKWLIENCPTTIGEQCAICSSNSALWNSGVDSNKKIASARKRKLNFYSNVYIIKNPSNPELENQVRLFRYGQKIFDKIMSAMKPDFQSDDPVDPFDLWNGADFKIKVKTVKDSGNNLSFPNYDDSVFMSPRSLSEDDEELESIWKKCYSLQDLIAPDKFKSEEELQKRLNYVLGTSTPTPSPVQEQESAAERQFPSSEEEIMEDLEKSFSRSKDPLEEDGDEEDILSRFQELAT